MPVEDLTFHPHVLADARRAKIVQQQIDACRDKGEMIAFRTELGALRVRLSRELGFDPTTRQSPPDITAGGLGRARWVNENKARHQLDELVSDDHAAR